MYLYINNTNKNIVGAKIDTVSWLGEGGLKQIINIILQYIHINFKVSTYILFRFNYYLIVFLIDAMTGKRSITTHDDALALIILFIIFY